MTGAGLTSLRGAGYTFDHCNLMRARCTGIDLRETVWVESRLRGAMASPAQAQLLLGALGVVLAD